MNPDELSHRFKYHPPKDQSVAGLHEHIRSGMHFTAEWLNDVLPEGREKALVMTHLEEAMMWANAAVARNQ